MVAPQNEFGSVIHLSLLPACLLEDEVPFFEKISFICGLYSYLPTASGFFLSSTIHMPSSLVPSAYSMNQSPFVSRCYILLYFSSVQLLSCVRLFAIPWTVAHQASQCITNSRRQLKLMSITSVMPSNHLALLSPSPPAFNLSQHQGLFQ